MMALLKRKYIDLLMLLVVAATAGWSGWEATRVYGDTLMLSAQSHLFGLRAAALFAAGQGWGCADCNEAEFPELAAFMARETAAIPRDAYPEACAQEFRRDLYFYYHYYLIAYMGVLFRVFGISVSTIHLACILMHVAAMAALYGLFRLLAGRLLSLVGALFVAVSPAYLLILPDFRDYGKTPFFLAVFLLLGLMARQPRSPRHLLLLAAATGFTAGIGYGFREDLLIVVPFAVAFVLTGASVSAPQEKTWRVIAALAIFPAFLLAVLPMLAGQQRVGGFRTAHTLLAGTTESIENTASFGYADYDFGFLGLDTPVAAAVTAYGLRHELGHPIPGFTRHYGAVGNRLYYDIARTFPGDLAGRALAAIEFAFRIPESGYVRQTLEDEPYTRDSRLYRIYVRQGPVNRFLSVYGFLLALLFLTLLSGLNKTQGSLFLGTLVYFGAYPSLLLEYRHLFHLAFLPVLTTVALAALVLRGAASVCRAARQKRLAPTVLTALKRGFYGLFLTAGAVYLLVGGVFLLRSVQAAQLRPLLESFNALELDPIPVLEEQQEEKVFLSLESSIAERLGRHPLKEGHVAPAYLALRFREAHRTVDFALMNTNLTFNRPCRIRLNGAGTYFFPVYDYGAEPDAIFEGIVLQAEDRALVEGLYFVENAETLPLWPFLALPDQQDTFLFHKVGLPDMQLRVLITEFLAWLDGNPERTLEDYHRYVRRYPHHGPFADRALMWADKIGTEQALRETWEVIGAFVPERRHKAALWLNGRAQQFQEQEDYPEALRCYEAALRVAPGDLWNRVRIGEIQEATGNMEEALSAYSAVLFQAPESPYTARLIDELFSRVEPPRDPEAFWREVADAHPESVVPHVHLGIHLERRDDLEGAEEAYARALQHRPDAAPALYRLGALEAQRTDLDAGLNRMCEAALLDPDSASEIAGRCAEVGAHFAERNDIGKAITAYTTALEISPADLWPRVRLGEIYERIGDDDKALEAYRAVLMQAPESPETAGKLDALMRRLDFTPAAARALWQDLVNTHPDAREPRARLEGWNE